MVVAKRGKERGKLLGLVVAESHYIPEVVEKATDDDIETRTDNSITLRCPTSMKRRQLKNCLKQVGLAV